MDLFAFNYLSLLNGCLAITLYGRCIETLTRGAPFGEAFSKWAIDSEAGTLAF
jgi:hypothetical protein